MLELTIIGIVIICLGVGLRLIPFLNTLDFIKTISNWLIIIPIIALIIISLLEKASETMLDTLIDFIFLVSDYWYVAVFILFVAFLIWRIRKE